jgi:hypothetical protein
MADEKAPVEVAPATETATASAVPEVAKPAAEANAVAQTEENGESCCWIVS